MPKRKSNIGQQTRNAKSIRARLAQANCTAATSIATTDLDVQREEFMLPNWNSFRHVAFSYNNLIEYDKHPFLSIGDMSRICEFCHAFKWQNETEGMCCSGGKILVPLLEEPPATLKSLLLGDSNESKEYLRNIRQYNSCFQMTSFGVSGNVDTYLTTFSIQGQIYHCIGSLLPTSDEHKFLQI